MRKSGGWIQRSPLYFPICSEIIICNCKCNFSKCNWNRPVELRLIVMIHESLRLIVMIHESLRLIVIIHESYWVRWVDVIKYSWIYCKHMVYLYLYCRQLYWVQSNEMTLNLFLLVFRYVYYYRNTNYHLCKLRSDLEHHNVVHFHSV